jgi:isopentenyl-diphosphate delta-isomerase
MEMVVLVDENDKELGTEEKLKAHQDGGKLHRAVSAFIFNSKGKMLLQKRAYSKYHAPGLWSNACCTHPRPGETPEEAVHRRLREEMGFDCLMKEVLGTVYEADVGRGLTEREFDHLFVGIFDGRLAPNREEVSDFRWSKLEELKAGVKNNPAHYAPWFRILLPKLLEAM